MISNFKSLLKSKPFLYASSSVAVVAFGVGGLLLLGSNHNNAQINACNSGNDDEACDYVLSLNPKDHYKSKLDSTVLKARDERKAAAVIAEAERDERIAAYEAAAVKRKAESAKAAEEESAKFKAEGWFQLATGIYGRWCTETCSNASVIGDASYWLLEVWAKDRTAGDIYARINVLEKGTVIGWTNDTSYLSLGQRGVMTFSKHLPGSGSNYSAQLTEFNARG